MGVKGAPVVDGPTTENINPKASSLPCIFTHYSVYFGAMNSMVAFGAMKRNFALKPLLGALLLSAALLPAQSNEDCLGCHSEKNIVAERGRARISVHVDASVLAGSIHRDLDCVNCHADLQELDLPHKRPAPVDCGVCHEDVAKLQHESLHGKAAAKGDPLAPRCSTCHGTHGVVAVRSSGSPVSPIKIPYLCGQCHKEGSPVQLQRDIPQDHIIENYSESIHGEGLMKKGLIVAATCISCHTSHHMLPPSDPRSSIARKNIAATCTVCHAQIESVHRKVVQGKLWEREAHVLPACVDCHQPHKVRKVFYEQGMADKDCLTCHAKPGLKARDGRAMTVDHGDLTSSRHAKVACAQCHSQVSPSRVRACETITEKVNCGACHAEIQTQYLGSEHGRLFLSKDPNAPVCTECHGTHHVLGRRDPISPIFAINIPNLCGRCHREGQRAAVRYKGTQRDIVHQYTESIHGKGLLKSGLTVTATCTDCHTSHGELPSKDAASSVNRANIALTCARCHHGIYDKFKASIHSPFVSKSDKKLPECSDCHSSHSIARTDKDDFKLDIMEKCGKCHEDIAKTYFDTYHGKVTQLGYTKTAKCYDCHGAHDILPIANPASHLSRQNVVETCRKCHPGANRKFAGYLTHATHHDPKKYPWLFYTFWGMTGLLVVTFTVSGLHTLLWLPRALQMHRRHKKEAGSGDTRLFQRFTRLERTLHVLMVISFIALALSGMTLKFSYTGWSVAVARLMGGFESAGSIHRAGAVLLFGIFFVHLWDLTFQKRKAYGSWWALLFGPNTMLPTWRDAREVLGALGWFVGLKPRPRYGHWTYWEKFDYFAVFWGVFVIGFSGLMLWFSEFFTRLFPGWLINVATIVHSDEALLAAGFIFTVHFFNTHLRPEKFPMDTVVFTGRMTVEELKEDKPEEYERLAASGELEKFIVEPLPEVVVKVIRAFAWTALGSGFFIVLWILYAMVFAYK